MKSNQLPEGAPLLPGERHPAEEAGSAQVHPASSHAYPVLIRRGWGEDLRTMLQDLGTDRLFVLSQKGLEEFVLKGFLQHLSIPEERVILLEPGEKNKHIDRLAPVYNRLIQLGADRHSVILAVGGGVVGDFAGFVAATLLRGIRFVQIPSTLLAAVDSSVGGKVAVNVDLGKNMVGAFHHPEFVYFNIELLRTLPGKEWHCGIGEIVKHAFMDPASLDWIEKDPAGLRDPDSEILVQAILLSIQFKSRVVSEDEKETGLRSILNLGHTTAHAIESVTRYSRFSHGEAVARGLVTALFLSRQMKGLSQDDEKRLLQLMERAGLPMDTDGLAGEDLWEHMKYDKKNRQGVVRFVLLEGTGRPVHGCGVGREDFLAAWTLQKKRYG